jgi:beta-lactamase class A
VTDFLAGRSGNVTAAVYNEETGTTFEYHPTFTDDTASIIKVDILATLLSQGQKDGAPLSEDEQELATQMIEASNNDAATELWDDAGAQTGVAAFDALVGMPNTVPNYEWGLTTTTALDQVTLVRHVAYPNALLTNASRAYELGLMENIDAGENWGISYGVPSGVTVALKNGWLPESSGWHINSIGFVDGDGKNYVIAVLTDDNPSESYGINTIQGLSSLVWKSIQP